MLIEPDDLWDTAMAFFQSAYHLKDWILRDHPDLRQRLDSEISGNHRLAICADICNGTKHSRVERNHRTKAHVVGMRAFAPDVPSKARWFVLGEDGPINLDLPTDVIAAWERVLAGLPLGYAGRRVPGLRTVGPLDYRARRAVEADPRGAASMKVDWSQPGETIEDLVAVLLRRENPMATQIRPSQGDGGMDVRAPFPTGGVEIFQVKKFNSTLNASQLRQIKESYESLNEYRLEHGLDVRAWHLLMPLNPTKENLEWFDELTTDAPFPCDWRGRDYLDGLAAKFPDVVDYYLQDGADRLALVVGQMLDLLRLTPKTEGAGVVTPAQLVEQLHALEPLLDTDPHFRYGISLDPAMPDPKDLGTGWVAATSSGMANGVVTVKIYPRFAEALEYRPVPGTVTFNVEPGSATEQDLERFIKYGTSLQTPFGSVDIDIDLPGGLGGSFEGGAVRIGPALGVGSSESGRLRLVAVDPSGASVAEVLVDMQPPSTGLDRTGFQVTGTDTAQVFDIELLGDVSGNSLKFSLQQRDLAGRSPSELLDAVCFLSALRAPNTLVIAQPFGPVTGQRLDLGGAADWLDFQALDNLELMLETLAAIQAHTPTQIVVPPAEAIYATTMNAWLTAKQLLEGQVVSVNGFSATVCIRPDADVPTEPIAIAMESEFFVHIGEQRVDLGRQVTHTPIAEVVPGSVVPHDDHQDCTFRSVDGVAVTIRVTQPPT